MTCNTGMLRLLDLATRRPLCDRRHGRALVAAFTATCLAFSASAFGQAQPEPRASGGALLYETHCIGCHSKQIHWRDRKLATDWASLAAQVRRWQANTGLQWTDEEIDEVTRYLNRTIYMFPETSPKRVV